MKTILRPKGKPGRPAKHGHASRSVKRSKTYSAWSAMKGRCFNMNNANFPHYGGRGITVCKRWMKFENFLLDMGTAPLSLELDRINNEGNYDPSNCRWATKQQQSWNTRQARLISYGGETMPIKAWAKKLGLDPETVKYRLGRWTIKDALTRSPRR